VRAVILALTLITWTGFGSGQYMNDNSDWWSLVRQLRQEGRCSTWRQERPAAVNFVIAGVDLQHGDPIGDAEKTVTEASVIERGDAGVGRAQICFKSASERGRFKLIFEEGPGEAGNLAYLIDGGPSWTGLDKCVVSRKISNDLATGSGLRLGMTAGEVKRILGKPCNESKGRIEYCSSSRHWLSSNERQRYRAETGEDAPPGDYAEWLGTVQIKFRGAKANYIAISTGGSPW
jgi:hypothetical protein